MKYYAYNSEPDGRLYITDGMGGARVVLRPNAVDAFIAALQKHVSSEGDGLRFSIDSRTGEVEAAASFPRNIYV